MSHPLLERTKAKRVGDGKYVACCPAHEDKDPSLSIGLLPDGRVLIHCHAGCAPADVLAAVGMSMGDLFPGDGLGNFGPLWWAQKERKEREQREQDIAKERLVLQLAAEDRRLGRRLSRSDLERERQAWLKVNGRV